MSDFCNIDNINSLPQPYIFAQQVIDEYNLTIKLNPPYIQNMESNIRTVVDNPLVPNVFHHIERSYNAYEKDIAVVNVYFDTPTVLKFETKSRMGWIDFLSSVGGLLGLCVGLSIVTLIELFWLGLRLGCCIISPVKSNKRKEVGNNEEL